MNDFHASARRRNFGLDAMRALAIILVLLAHGGHYLDCYLAAYRLPYWSMGVVGVTLFFALSGLLIGTILLDIEARDEGRPAALGRFVLRRWMRTLPLYYLTLALVRFVPKIDPTPHKLVWPYAVMAQNLFRPMKFNWYGISWTLTIEEWSYLLLPLLVFLFLRLTRQPVLIAAAALCIAGPLLRYFGTGPGDFWDENIHRVVLFRADAIGWGVIFAWLMRYREAALKRMEPWLALAGAAALLSLGISCCYGPMKAPAIMPDMLVRVFLLSLASCGAASLLPFAMRMQAHVAVRRPIEFLAKISYALYLAHFTLMHDHLDFLAPKLRFPAYLDVAVVLATILSYAVEQPIMKLRPRN